uniref:hypothetical protein n=1 Tax=Larkinella sp. C7 TaxID=2576607 RepID=UPI001BB1F9D7
RNDNQRTFLEFDRILAFFLVPAFTGGTDEDLPTALSCFVDMPVVATSRFKSNIVEGQLTIRSRS